MKRFSVYKLLFIVLCLGMTGNVWGAKTYNAKVTVGAKPTGENLVYVGTSTEKSTENNASQTTLTSGGDLTFYLWAENRHGYDFENWTNDANQSVIGRQQEGQSWTVQASTTVNGTKEYKAIANYKRKQIELTMAQFTGVSEETALTFDNPEYTGGWAVVCQNIVDETNWKSATTSTPNANLDFTRMQWPVTLDGAENLDIAAFPMTYTLPLEDDEEMKKVIDKISNGKIPVAATFVAGEDGMETRTLEGSGEIEIDLKPYFTIITPPEHLSAKIGERITATIEAKLVTTNTNIADKIKWSIPQLQITGDDEIAYNMNSDNGKFSIVFVPWDKGIYKKTFPITATYLGISYTVPCEVIGLCEVTKGEINVLQGETNYNTQPFVRRLGDGSIISETFMIEHIGVTDLAITPANVTTDALQYSTTVIDDSHTELTISGKIDAVGELTKTLTFNGTSTIGEAQAVETVTLDLQFIRTYADPNFNATTTDEAIALTWDANPYAESYMLKRDGVVIATPAASSSGYTDEEADRTKMHSYVLEITIEGKTYTVIAKSMPTGVTVDFSAAYDENGKAVMDVLYVITSETNCDIYDVQDDLTYAKRSGTYNPTTWRPGRIDGTGNSKFTKVDGTPDNKRVYITGRCENLFWNGTNADGKDNNMGWMQPVNCHVYLDNVALQAASMVTHSAIPIATDIYNLLLMNTADYIWRGKVAASASVFYLPEGNNQTDNTSIFHLNRENYLGGNVAKSWAFSLNAPYIEMLGRPQYFTEVAYKAPGYSAPIAIKDASFFDTRAFIKEKSTDDAIVATKDSLRKDPYCNIPNLPKITCEFDAVWVDGKVVDGYLDLSARPCQRGDVNTAEINASDATAAAKDNVLRTYWTNLEGYRYTSPLVTGGYHGKFVINGGRINLWPANGATTDIYYQIQVSIVLLKLVAGHVSNYLVCGTNCFNMSLDKNVFSQTDDSYGIIVDELEKLRPAPMVLLYGLGQGKPIGSLEINGGTITTNTDPLSFAYDYVDASGAPQKNIDQDGSGQPLLGPANLTITGGTFQTPIYATTKHGAGLASEATKWTDAVTDADKKTGVNKAKTPQTLSLVDINMPAANMDYSDMYGYDVRESSALTPNNDEVGYIVHAGTADEYQYGMANVWSDKNAALCHFYLPASKGAFYRNYWVKNGDKPLSTFDKPAYNITVDAGGEITAQDVLVPGRIAYRPVIEEEKYQTIAMPFTVEKMYATEPDGDFYFTGYVEDCDATNATDNSAAYAYIYHFDDGEGNPYALAADETFKDYYHSHADGLMQKGKTYVMKFPDYAGYFEDNPVTLLGAKGQTINATNDYQGIDAMRPAANNNFALVGNATFMTQDITGESVYLLNPADNCFYINNSQTTLAPLQGVVLANEVTSRRVRVLGKPDVTTDLGNTLAGATVIGGDDKIVVIPAAQTAAVQVYAADGQLVGTYTAAEGTSTLIPATAGVYMVRIADCVTKVMVW